VLCTGSEFGLGAHLAGLHTSEWLPRCYSTSGSVSVLKVFVLCTFYVQGYVRYDYMRT
jgi:hypothetical protein